MRQGGGGVLPSKTRATRVALCDQRAALWTARRWKEKTQRAREVAPRRSAPRTSACANARARSGPQPACGTPSHCSHAKSARPASKSTQHRWHGVATDTSHVVHRPAERSRRLQLTSVHVPVCGQKGRSRTVIESAMNSSTCFPGRFESVHQSSGQPRIVHACDARTHSRGAGVVIGVLLHSDVPRSNTPRTSAGAASATAASVDNISQRGQPCLQGIQSARVYAS